MTLNDCIELFIKLERKAYIKYLSFTEILKSEELCKAAKFLAEQEEKHIDMLRELQLNTLSKEVNVNKEILQHIESELNEEEKMKFDDISEKDFFLMALKMEEDICQIYKEFQGLVSPNTEEYEVFQYLIKEEREHSYVILNALHKI